MEIKTTELFQKLAQELTPPEREEYKKQIFESIKNLPQKHNEYLQEIERSYQVGNYFLRNYKPYYYSIDVFSLIKLLKSAILTECEGALSKDSTDLYDSDRRRLMLLFGCLNELDFGVENQSNREFEKYLLEFFEKKYIAKIKD